MRIPDELSLYRRSEDFIWTDEHISKGMLAAHLDFTSDAASRNIRTIDRTVEWISQKIPHGGRVLDLGCGPGLYASRLGKKGYDVTGIDISKRSVAYAREKALEENIRIDYRWADYLRDDIGTGYDGVLCIYCDFGALLPAELEILLHKVRDALKREGTFIFDVFKPEICLELKEKKTWQSSPGRGFWSGKPHILLEEVRHFPDQKAWGTRNVVMEEGKEAREFIIWDHYFTEAEIKELLLSYGLGVASFNTRLVSNNTFTSSQVMFVEANKEG
ncbi:class I SAM-dependent methyltransferase [Candidatus Contubernalis alkaliaceticus]|uniref:class I SAM-dependent methyltransferase n=1 Tax=Candidatus Contubernalis alkaliaceticus TaxID=338645 RepID=UPI001F4C4A26|nr:class I SAM-dependent methyltransferase [Candidatus Contubernalis alkalaceticus]UNC91923.1 methyltransferase domain-containing protein [Candidatus Contubernalis alkalaceticus]